LADYAIRIIGPNKANNNEECSNLIQGVKFFMVIFAAVASVATVLVWFQYQLNQKLKYEKQAAQFWTKVGSTNI